MVVLDWLWNCFLLMIFLGVLKAALSFYWPSIGEWRYDDLHPSVRYHESCRAKQLFVNGVFFIVYPCVLCYRWSSSYRGTLWTECCVEKDELQRYVEYSREEEDLLRHGMIRGRMIIQKAIVVPGSSEDDGTSYRKYDTVDDCVIAVERHRLSDEEQNQQSKCEPLNLSKDGKGCDLDNEATVLMQQCREDRVRIDAIQSSTEDEGDDDEIRLIPPSARELLGDNEPNR